MAKFIELTMLDGNGISVCLPFIVSFGVDGDGITNIETNNMINNRIHVKESYEEVKKLLGVE